MPGAVLHVSGENLDPASVLASLSLQPYRVYRKGERIFSTGPKSRKLHQFGGFCCDVSSADGQLSIQAQDAVAFLTEHHDDLARLRDEVTIDKRTIDFGYWSRLDGDKVMVQYDSLPAELLRLAGELHIGFELSLYPADRSPSAR
jgi:Domain of unknown function (DUF4279)